MVNHTHSTNVVADHTIAATFTQGSTLINTGFDGNPWDDNWMAGGNPPWRAAAQVKASQEALLQNQIP